MESIAKHNILRPYHADDHLIMDKLDLLPELQSHDITYLRNHSTTQREYLFALFLFRYCILDVGLWLWRHTELKLPGNIMCTSLPDTQSIVSSKIATVCLAMDELIFYSRPGSKNYMTGRAWSALPEIFAITHENIFW